MPTFIYKPEGADPLSWTFDAEKLKSSEIMAIEKITDLTYAEWADAAERGSITAVHALLYVLLRRDRPNLEPSQVPDFDISEIEMRADEPAPKAPKKAATKQGG
jgi:hypothetical protein